MYDAISEILITFRKISMLLFPFNTAERFFGRIKQTKQSLLHHLFKKEAVIWQNATANPDGRDPAGAGNRHAEYFRR